MLSRVAASPCAPHRTRRHRSRALPGLAPVAVNGASTKEPDTGSSSAALLELVADTESGAVATPEKRASILAATSQLEAGFADRGADARQDPRLFGNWRVAYTSSPQAAGGRLRSPLGRAVFATTGLRQDVLRPAVVRNRVSFRLLGLPGCVELEGPFAPVKPLVVTAAGVAAVADEGAFTQAPAQSVSYAGAVEAREKTTLILLVFTLS